MKYKWIRVIMAVCLSLAAPFLIGFDTHGLPKLLKAYHPTAQALWVGLGGDTLVLISAALHLATYGGLAYLLLGLVRRRGEETHAV
jgi:hypothetical protein